MAPPSEPAAPSRSGGVPATATAGVAGQEADNDVEEVDDAVDDGHDDRADAVENSHDGPTDGAEG
jgi:hypothetical protein